MSKWRYFSSFLVCPFINLLSAPSHAALDVVESLTRGDVCDNICCYLFTIFYLLFCVCMYLAE